MATIKPTIYLVKEGITDPKKIFRKEVKLDSVVNGDAVIFYVKSKPYTPEWVEFLDENFTIDRKFFKNSNSRAVIVIKLPKRLMAIPLGLGMHFIDLTKTDYNFGLKTALNCIPKAAVRQIDTTTPEINSKKTKKQAPVGTTPEELGINKQKDILRGVTGKLPHDHKLGKSLEGKDSIRVSMGVENIEKLKVLCKDVLFFFESDTYKKDYPWIDNIALVRDNSIIEKLSKALVSSLKNGRISDMLFVPPVFYDTIFNYEGFAFTNADHSRVAKKDLFEMPDISDWKKNIGVSRKYITQNNLDNYKVVLVGDEIHSNLSWPLQRCLSWEILLDKEKYILSEGSWYNVATDFYKEVEEFYLSKVLVRTEIKKPSKSKIKESDYNFEIANSSKAMHLFDLGHNLSKNKHIGVDRNEVCDVYNSEARIFYHVKMGKSSSDLSHLFRQGAFSSDILKREEAVCKQFIKHLVDYGCKSDIIKLPYMPTEYQIAFIVVLGKTQKKNIPFFSKVSFMDTVRNIEMFGYSLSISFVGGR